MFPLAFNKLELCKLELCDECNNSTHIWSGQFSSLLHGHKHLLGHYTKGLGGNLDGSSSVDVDLGEIDLHAHFVVGIAGLLAGVFAVLLPADAATVIEDGDHRGAGGPIQVHANRADASRSEAWLEGRARGEGSGGSNDCREGDNFRGHDLIGTQTASA
jgi:hypothetical protein